MQEWIVVQTPAGNPNLAVANNYVLPVDSPKKEQAPPPQMVTFPVSSITAKMTLNGYSQVRFQDYEDGDPKTAKD